MSGLMEQLLEEAQEKLERQEAELDRLRDRDAVNALKVAGYDAAVAGYDAAKARVAELEGEQYSCGSLAFGYLKVGKCIESGCGVHGYDAVSALETLTTERDEALAELAMLYSLGKLGVTND